MEHKDYLETLLVITVVDILSLFMQFRVPRGQWVHKECREFQDLMDQKEPQEKLDPWYVGNDT